MRKIKLLIILLCAVVQTWADTWADSNGINWTFSVIGTNATGIKPTNRNVISSTVTIPSKVNGYTVTSIDDEAFRGCLGMTRVNIPESVTRIGEEAFASCTSMTSVTIPNSVTIIDDNAFYGCSELNCIECRAATPPNGYVDVDADEQMFSTYNTATLLVPPASIMEYRNAEGWSLFQNIESIPYWHSYWTDENGVIWGFYNHTIFSCSNATGEVIIPTTVYDGGVSVGIS